MYSIALYTKAHFIQLYIQRWITINSELNFRIAGSGHKIIFYFQYFLLKFAFINLFTQNFSQDNHVHSNSCMIFDHIRTTAILYYRCFIIINRVPITVVKYNLEWIYCRIVYCKISLQTLVYNAKYFALWISENV